MRENLCWCSVYCEAQGVLLGRNSNLSNAHMSSLLCDMCNDCTCENVVCDRCICLQNRCNQFGRMCVQLRSLHFTPNFFPLLVKVALQSHFDSPTVCEETPLFYAQSHWIIIALSECSICTQVLAQSTWSIRL